jgi:hypothetical protein
MEGFKLKVDSPPRKMRSDRKGKEVLLFTNGALALKHFTLDKLPEVSRAHLRHL